MKIAVVATSLALALCYASPMGVTPARADSAGAAVAAGIGGFALGAIAGGALARPAPPAYYPAPTPVYVAPPPPRCWTESRPLFDEYGYVVGYRPRRVCE
ncbi:hypothetical protein [Methylocystis bryophila]|uniref:Lectin-like protein BA14k n=1 Tax=Methylocystis bryophila TaxID=655015 RepID=A0A1W6MZR6_9HYPH|nr:hypothetical protein [Methylocystis bryophila]ARN83068.1 hypothetical protein B1812_20495 [Methylocystis bryophila]BDV39380.1 hypothetical protein DSM21852_26330 [Methylocystis bryophila]